MNPYSTLGVPKDASAAEIKAAFRSKAKKHHPDSGVEPNKDEFSRASDAHQLLINPARREKFDKTGDTDSSTLSDPVFAKAMEIIGSIVGSLMDDDNALSMNIPKEIDGALHRAAEKANDSLQRLIKMRSKYERAIKKMKRKKGAEGENVLLAVLTSTISQIARPIESATENVNAIKRAIELLDSGSYEFVPDPAAQAYPNAQSLNDIMLEAMRAGSRNRTNNTNPFGGGAY